MSREDKMTTEEFHKRMAMETNNSIWPILDNPNPTQEELATGLDMAHASRYHWGKVGERINLARADYMISRVASAMKRGEPALFHARRCLQITQEEGVGDWDLAFAYEALTRAFAVVGDKIQYRKHQELAKKAIADVKEEGDRKAVQNELDKVVLK